MQLPHPLQLNCRSFFLTFVLSMVTVIKWKYFPHYWPSVWGIHRSPANSSHKGQLRGALMLSLICARTSGWVNNREAGDLRRHGTHYDIIVMGLWHWCELFEFAPGRQESHKHSVAGFIFRKSEVLFERFGRSANRSFFVITGFILPWWYCWTFCPRQGHKLQLTLHQ